MRRPLAATRASSTIFPAKPPHKRRSGGGTWLCRSLRIYPVVGFEEGYQDPCPAWQLCGKNCQPSFGSAFSGMLASLGFDLPGSPPARVPPFREEICEAPLGVVWGRGCFARVLRGRARAAFPSRQRVPFHGNGRPASARAASAALSLLGHAWSGRPPRSPVWQCDERRRLAPRRVASHGPLRRHFHVATRREPSCSTSRRVGAWPCQATRRGVWSRLAFHGPPRRRHSKFGASALKEWGPFGPSS